MKWIFLAYVEVASYDKNIIYGPVAHVVRRPHSII